MKTSAMCDFSQVVREKDFISRKGAKTQRFTSILSVRLRDSPFQLAKMVNQEQIINQSKFLLELTYEYSVKELPAVIDDYLTQLPGGEDWKLGKR
jgi:hypothetical protein